MATWLIVLIVVLGVVVGIPVYALIGEEVARYVIAILAGCAEWLEGGFFSHGYQTVVNCFPWWVVLLWPLFLFVTLVLLAISLVIGWIRLIKYCLSLK